MTFFSVFIKQGGGGWDADGRVLLEILELIRSQNCKIPPTHELKKRDSNSKLLTGLGKIRTVKKSDLGLENAALWRRFIP